MALLLLAKKSGDEKRSLWHNKEEKNLRRRSLPPSHSNISFCVTLHRLGADTNCFVWVVGCMEGACPSLCLRLRGGGPLCLVRPLLFLGRAHARLARTVGRFFRAVVLNNRQRNNRFQAK